MARLRVDINSLLNTEEEYRKDILQETGGTWVHERARFVAVDEEGAPFMWVMMNGESIPEFDEAASVLAMTSNCHCLAAFVEGAHLQRDDTTQEEQRLYGGDPADYMRKLIEENDPRIQHSIVVYTVYRDGHVDFGAMPYRTSPTGKFLGYGDRNIVSYEAEGDALPDPIYTPMLLKAMVRPTLVTEAIRDGDKFQHFATDRRMAEIQSMIVGVKHLKEHGHNAAITLGEKDEQKFMRAIVDAAQQLGVTPEEMRAWVTS